ncbi:hypothetical protein PC119_g24767 [Phytophthora cactorum]|nr:hypothetical protein PC111_g23190 [Phytophthora cactorum]KAG2966253.1 hypothetical protein PC119_g24767 [Phytophthora cactorum]KAG2980567.1 hypothetical protein PC120_g24942 [Phytophthora cactorum]
MPPAKKRKATNEHGQLKDQKLLFWQALGWCQVTEGVREDYDTVGDDESIASFRLNSARQSGIVTESNKVLYDKYYGHRTFLDGRPCLVMITDSVDKDDLHPYDPKLRIRLDVGAAFSMMELRQKRSRDGNKYKTSGVACTQPREIDAGATTGDAKSEGNEEKMTVIVQSAIFLKILCHKLTSPQTRLV